MIICDCIAVPATAKQTPGGTGAKHKLFDLLRPPFAGPLEFNFVSVYFNDFHAVNRASFVYYFAVNNSRLVALGVEYAGQGHILVRGPSFCCRRPKIINGTRYNHNGKAQ